MTKKTKVKKSLDEKAVEIDWEAEASKVEKALKEETEWFNPVPRDKQYAVTFMDDGQVKHDVKGYAGKLTTKAFFDVKVEGKRVLWSVEVSPKAKVSTWAQLCLLAKKSVGLKGKTFKLKVSWTDLKKNKRSFVFDEAVPIIEALEKKEGGEEPSSPITIPRYLPSSFESKVMCDGSGVGIKRSFKERFQMAKNKARALMIEKSCSAAEVKDAVNLHDYLLDDVEFGEFMMSLQSDGDIICTNKGLFHWVS